MITQEQLQIAIEDANRLWHAIQTNDPALVETALAATDRLDAVAVVLAAALPVRNVPPTTPTRGRCGSEIGYHDHIGLGERPCLECRRAHTQYRQQERTHVG